MGAEGESLGRWMSALSSSGRCSGPEGWELAGEVGGRGMQDQGEPGRQETKASSERFQKVSKGRRGCGEGSEGGTRPRLGLPRKIQDTEWDILIRIKIIRCLSESQV